MTFVAPEIPSTLTHAYWNKKKGVIARMKNDVETGIGSAADDVKEKFKKIDWGVFDIQTTKPAFNGEKAIKRVDELFEGMKVEWTRTIKPTIEAIKTLATNAKEAGPELTKAKYTDAAKAALEISKDATLFAASLQLNGSFFEGVLKEIAIVKKEKDDRHQENNETAGDPKVWLNKVINGLKVLNTLKLPLEGEDPVKWQEQWRLTFAKNVTQNGRSLGNALKSEPKLSKHLHLWSEKFVGFVPNAMPYFKEAVTPAQKMAQ